MLQKKTDELEHRVEQHERTIEDLEQANLDLSLELRNHMNTANPVSAADNLETERLRDENEYLQEQIKSLQDTIQSQ